MTEEANQAAEDWRARAEQAEAALQRVQSEAEARLIQAELKAEAVRAGMVDLDGLKLLDVSAITLSETGEVADAAGHMQRLKRAKPWLFGGSSSSVAAHPPRPEPPRQRHASELSHEEWMAARAAMLRRK